MRAVLHCRRGSRRWISTRGQQLAAVGGRAAAVWETVNGLAAKPGMLNMGQGFPDYPGSSVARAVAASAMEGGTAPLNQYSPQTGLLSLREQICEFIQRRYQVRYDPGSEVVVTTGAQESLAAAFLAFLNPGDEVQWRAATGLHSAVLPAAGAVPRVVTLRAPGFEIDSAALEEAIQKSGGRAKMIVLNTPHNPTGHVATQRELQAVASLCIRHDLIAVADDVYENCVYDGQTHHRLAQVDGMHDRTITISSGGKLFSLTGWRVAWAVGPSKLVGPLSQAHTHLTFNAPTPLQAGIAAALECEDGLAETADLYGGNFKLLADALKAGTGVTNICEAQGGYFLVAETDGRSDMAFCKSIADEKGVACTPMSVFYSRPQDECKMVRFTVCKSREYILKACAALTSGVKSR